jgi:GNAT superfamily N-acetyltransferase
LRSGGVGDVSIRAATPEDHGWIRTLLFERWGSEAVVAHETLFRPLELPGLVAMEGGEPIGLVTYHVNGDACEIVTIDSLDGGRGVGTALVDSTEEVARKAGCRRLWLITTNDNRTAIRFYERRGFRLAAVREGAIDRARKLKPEIPLLGQDGIPIRDELEYERLVDGS